MLWREAYRQAPLDHEVSTFEEWLRASETDVNTPQSREVCCDGQSHTIRVPLVPARARSLWEYRQELEASGFGIVEMDAEDQLSVAIVTRTSASDRPVATDTL